MSNLLATLRPHIDRERLLATATEIIAVPSPTGDCGAVCDTLANLMAADGFVVERHAGGHPTAPAVVAYYDTGVAGPCIQFDGHVDVVHLPFVPPRIEGDTLYGSGSCDMKAGTIAAYEAMRAVRDSGLLQRGKIMFCAHDLHEAPWGLGQQLDTLIRAGLHGDAVLIPEALCTHLPMIGRGSATWKAFLRRRGSPVHEVMRPLDEPSVISAGASFVRVLNDLDRRISSGVDSPAGKPSVFIGQIHSGEIYNQYPQECLLEGTCRWLPGTDYHAVEKEFRQLLQQEAADHGVQLTLEWRHIRDGFALDGAAPFVQLFEDTYANHVGTPLPRGAKMFVDDGNSFTSLGGVPAITHGPKGGGQHTVHEWVDIPDLVRVAELYAVVAVRYLHGE